jgi:hypothetical protein
MTIRKLPLTYAQACAFSGLMNENPLTQQEAFFEDLFWLRVSRNSFELSSENIARALKECSTLSKVFFAYLEEERAQAARAAAAAPAPTPTRETPRRKGKRNSQGEWSP